VPAASAWRCMMTYRREACVLPCELGPRLRKSSISAVGRITVKQGKGGWNGHEARSRRDGIGEESWRESTMRAEGQRRVRPRSRGLRAGSDVSHVSVLPCSHSDAR
jgi:hypothetical protein